MDLLVEGDATAKVQEAVLFAVANLLNLEVDLLLFDTTSTYFERQPKTGTARPAPGSAVTATPRTSAATCRRS